MGNFYFSFRTPLAHTAKMWYTVGVVRDWKPPMSASEGDWKTMAEKSIEEVKETVMRGLEHARWKLLEKAPFIGEMLLRFSIVPTYDCRINTAATDGSKIFFDCEFYSKLTDGQRQFVLAHEVWHNIFLHFLRRQARDIKMWNIATDMEINHMLQNEGMEVLPDGCFPDPIVAGKNAEDIYAYLMKEMQKQQKKNGGKGQGQGNPQNGEGGEGDSDGDQDGDSQDGSSSSSGKGKQKNGGGSGSQTGNGNGNNKTKHGNQFDKHIYEGEGAGQGQEKDGKWGKKGFDKDFNPQTGDAKETEEKIKDMVCAVAQSIERKQGHLPAGIASIVKEMLKPEINWKEALSQFVTKCLGGEHSWKRCSRHALGRGMYLPGKMEDKIKLALGVDTSGSYLSDLPKFLGELKSLLSSFGKYEITIIQCDAEVQDVKNYSDDNPIDVDKFETKGGGGTSFKPVFKWVRESGEEYNCLVYFTDGYGDAPTYPIPGLPTLWVLTSDGCEDFCDWGEKMKFKADRDGNI